MINKSARTLKKSIFYIKNPLAAIDNIKQRLLFSYQVNIKKNQSAVAYAKWLKENGDMTRRFTHQLGPESIVFDVGGFKGDFAEKINLLYGCSVYLFEPVKKFYEHCEKRFLGNTKIKCFNYGLSDSDGCFHISNESNGSSIVKNLGIASGEKVIVKSFSSTLKELQIGKIDLMELNIEGGGI
jgi:FkbM family methyltransferase